MTTASTTDMTAILDKIARLKTLAERPGTPEEAAAALAGIQRLMLRYNLTEEEVDAAGRNEERGFDKFEFDLGASMMWRKNLMTRIARYSFCEAIFDHAGRRVWIIGEKHNVQVVKGLYDYLTDAIMRLADDGYKALDIGERMFVKPRAWKHAFRTGAGQAVGDRLYDQWKASQREAEAENARTSAIVLVKSEELANAVASFFPKLGTSRQRASYSDSHGLAAGKAAGRQINLAQQITG